MVLITKIKLLQSDLWRDKRIVQFGNDSTLPSRFLGTGHLIQKGGG